MFVVTNTIRVKAGAGEHLAERFKTPKSVHTMPGFVRLNLWKELATEEYEEFKVCTFWENEEAFQAWTESEQFRSAHERRANSPQDTVISSYVSKFDVIVEHLPAGEEAAK